MIDTMQSPMTSFTLRPADDLAFLEPPHRHDLLDLFYATSPPPNVIGTTDADLRDAVHAMSLSTSILLASLKRLRLCQQDRHMIEESSEAGTNTTNIQVHQCDKASSDPICFNWMKRLHAEWLYFNEEALPDWHGKAYLVNGHLTRLAKDSAEKHTGFLPAAQVWLQGLQILVSTWEIEARQLSAASVT